MRYALLALTLSLACCEEYPQYRTGTWQPVGANDANLRAMIADPNDLVVGRADRRADGHVVAAAVARYRAGKVKDLQNVAISKVAPNAGVAAAAPAVAAE